MCHDLLPWDDDIDIMVRHNDRIRMEKALIDLGSEYSLVNHTSEKHMKFFMKSTPKKWKFAWAWPFIDISFYDENSTHAWEIGHENDASRVYPRNETFPLHRRPLGPLWLPCPRDTRTFLMRSIKGPDKTFRCGQQGWQHSRETVFSKNLVSCHHLLKDYAVVHRSAAPGGIIEKLIDGVEVMHSCFIQEPKNAVTRGPFTFDLLSDSNS